MSDRDERFIEYLRAIMPADPTPAQRSAAARHRAILRRSLAFDPGTHVPAFPLVEPFLQPEDSDAIRKAYYATAGIYALMPVPASASIPSFAQAWARMDRATQAINGSTGFERRFRALLEADPTDALDHLRHAARRMAAAGDTRYAFDHRRLLLDLKEWLREAPDPDRMDRIRVRWARDFYAPPPSEEAPPSTSPSPKAPDRVVPDGAARAAPSIHE